MIRQLTRLTRRDGTRGRPRAITAALLATGLVATLAVSAPAAFAHRPSAPKPTVVLVHGAFADASSWYEVTERLLDRGYPVVAPSNPLRGLDTDVQYLRDVLASVEGPIVLVGHSYGGFVVTNAATGDPDVKALVYVAAFAPDAGESVGSISQSAPGSLLTPDRLSVHAYTGPDGEVHHEGTIAVSSYREVFAADVSRKDAHVYAVSQKPTDLSILEAASGEPAWRTIPTWTVVATQDQVIPPAAQRVMAERADARVVEVRASHSVALSKPRDVVAVIERAARAAGARS